MSLLVNCNIINTLKDYNIYHKIEDNYNLVLGYVLSQKLTKDRIIKSYENNIQENNNTINDDETIEYIKNKIDLSIKEPEKYIDFLENQYGDILTKIENKNLSL